MSGSSFFYYNGTGYADQFNGLPFVAGDVQGVRSWDVDQLGRLISPSYKTVWVPGENVAECKKSDADDWVASYNWAMNRAVLSAFAPSPKRRSLFGGSSDHSHAVAQPSISVAAVEKRAPKEPPHSQAACACGFYAYSNGANDYSNSDRLTGVIQGYGETQLGTRGFKCSKAVVLALHIPDKAKRVKPGQVSTRSRHFERVIENYPGVQIFGNYADMLEAFPTYEHVPTPETDPDFWTRSI